MLWYFSLLECAAMPWANYKLPAKFLISSGKLSASNYSFVVVVVVVDDDVVLLLLLLLLMLMLCC